jgi:hypothetical protein
LKNELLGFFSSGALDQNTTLQELDVTGHSAGDDLAIALARVLQSNKGRIDVFLTKNLQVFIQDYAY